MTIEDFFNKYLIERVRVMPHKKIGKELIKKSFYKENEKTYLITIKVKEVN